jgi:signal transduction histidine kinase
LPRAYRFGVGDEQRRTQVLLNLFGNAIKFTDKGEVRISTSAVNSHFAVRVSDTEPGIPMEERASFSNFTRATDAKAKDRTGLATAPGPPGKGFSVQQGDRVRA